MPRQPDTSGNANTATALLNAQTITLTGAITGSGSFTGDAGTTISTTGSGFVDTSNSQSIGGIKTFTNEMVISGTRLSLTNTSQAEKIQLMGHANSYIAFYGARARALNQTRLSAVPQWR